MQLQTARFKHIHPGGGGRQGETGPRFVIGGNKFGSPWTKARKLLKPAPVDEADSREV